jgi:hypothetical protein
MLGKSNIGGDSFCVHINIFFYYSMHVELRYFWRYSYTIILTQLLGKNAMCRPPPHLASSPWQACPLVAPTSGNTSLLLKGDGSGNLTPPLTCQWLFLEWGHHPWVTNRLTMLHHPTHPTLLLP